MCADVPTHSVDVPVQAVSLNALLSMLKRTPLFAAHQKLGGKLIESRRPYDTAALQGADLAELVGSPAP